MNRGGAPAIMTRDPRPVPEASPLVATTEPSPRVLDRPAGRPIVVALAAVAVFAPAYLFADPLSTYRLHSDDFAYLGASRSFSKAVSNLFIPHNTHVVPAWRMLTWVVMATAGRLGNLQTVLAGCSYAILVAAILLTARIVTRETRSTLAGLVSASAVGTTSVLMRAATWYSAGQTLWAGFGILATLWYLQGWRRTGRARDLVLAAISAWVAGGMWTIGHVAGPAGAAYLLADGRKKARIASLVPLGTTAFAVLVAAVVGGPRMNAKISFHGRTAKDAVNFVTGATHTFQAIPETLVCGNLGLTPTHADPGHGALGGDPRPLGLVVASDLAAVSPGGGRRDDLARFVLCRVELPGLLAVFEPSRRGGPVV